MERKKLDIEKPSLYRYAILIGIILIVSIILIWIINSNPDNKMLTFKNQDDQQETTDNESEINDGTDVPTSDSSDEATTSNETDIDDNMSKRDNFANLDIDAEVKQIRSWYYSPTNNDEKFTLGKGTDGWNYSREYYFHDGKLNFVFIYSGTEEHRLYFKDDVMIRYIDENKKLYNYGDTFNFFELEERVLNESKKFYE